MAQSVSKQLTPEQNRERARWQHQDLLSVPVPFGPEADILALQNAAGNQAVSAVLAPTQNRLPATVDGVSPVAREVLYSGGEPLDSVTRTFMEDRFDEDFSQVRVHTDAQAAASAVSVNASAYTVGQNVVFAPGIYQPQTVQGQRLLAHELAHVVQQNRGGATPPLPVRNGSIEQAADRTASMAMNANSPLPVMGTSAVGIARQPGTLNTTLAPTHLSSEELVQEIDLIVQWLQDNPSSSLEQKRLVGLLETLLTQAQLRQIGSYQDQHLQAIFRFLPGDVQLLIHAANLGNGFITGFLSGAKQGTSTYEIDPIAQLEMELGGMKNRLLFHLGLQVGVGLGAGIGLWENIAGLVELGASLAKLYILYATPSGIAWRTFQEMRAYRALKAQEAHWRAELVTGLWEFYELLQSDPTYLMKEGNELGYAVGAEAAHWFVEGFMKQTPFDKGMTVGKVGGRILIEVALLFLGPEEWAARGFLAIGQAAKGGRVGQWVLRLLNQVPRLRRILQSRSLTDEIDMSMVAMEKVGEIGATSQKAVAAADPDLVPSAVTSRVETTENTVVTEATPSTTSPAAIPSTSQPPAQPMPFSNVGASTEMPVRPLPPESEVPNPANWNQSLYDFNTIPESALQTEVPSPTLESEAVSSADWNQGLYDFGDIPESRLRGTDTAISPRSVGSPGTGHLGRSERSTGMNYMNYTAAEVALGMRSSYSPEHGGYLQWVEFDVPSNVGNFGTGPKSLRQDPLLKAINVAHPARANLTRTGTESGHAVAQQLSGGDPAVAAALMTMTNVWPMRGLGSTGVNQGAYKRFETSYIQLKAANPGAHVRVRVEADFGPTPTFVTGSSGRPVLVPDVFNISVVLIPPGGGPPQVQTFVIPNR